MPNLTKMIARQNAQFYYMMDVMRRFELDMHTRIEHSGRIPPEWHDIAKQQPERVKREVNIGLDEEVLKFFKSLGKGYCGRINLILKSFIHARLAGVLEGAETVNHFKTWESQFDEPKPEFGFLAGELGETWQDASGEVTRQTAKEQRSAIIRRAQAKRMRIRSGVSPTRFVGVGCCFSEVLFHRVGSCPDLRVTYLLGPGRRFG